MTEKPPCPLPDLAELLVDIPLWEYRTIHWFQRAVCRLRVWATVPGVDGVAGKLAVVTELPENPGMSVTNAAESILAALHASFPGPLITMEHYADSCMTSVRGHRLDRTWLHGHLAEWQPVWPVHPNHPEYALHALWAEAWFHAITGAPPFDPGQARTSPDTLEG